MQMQGCHSTVSPHGALLTFQLKNCLCKELPVMLLEALHHHDIHVFNHPESIAIKYLFKKRNITIHAQWYYGTF